MNIAFVIDTSPSMIQRVSSGPSFLDCSKAGVSQILRSRGKYPESASDTYHLLTTDPSVQCSFENDTSILSTVGYLQITDKNTSLNEAIKQAFYCINALRHINSTDTYGYGRNPSKIEPGCVVVFTDNCSDLSKEAWKSTDSCSLTVNAWRYDQRLFVVKLQSASYNFCAENNDLPEQTGGCFINCFSFAQVLETSEKISSIMHENVFTVSIENEDKVNFPLICRADRKYRYNFWPIPEEYLNYSKGFVPRPSNPRFYYKQTQTWSVLKVVPDFPVDTYEVIRSSAFDSYFEKYYSEMPSYIPLYVKGHGCPSGVLSTGDSIKLLIMPYNFPELLESLDYYKTTTGTNQERVRLYEEKFNTYLANLPPYYAPHIYNLIKKLGIYLPPTIKLPGIMSVPAEIISDLKVLRERELIFKEEIDNLRGKIEPVKFSYHIMGDVFAIPRESLSQAVNEMQMQMFQSKHNVPISKMGDFQSALLPSTYRNPYMEPEHLKIEPINFGNPFRKTDMSTSNLLDDNPNLVMPKPMPSTNEFVTITVKVPKGFQGKLEESNFTKRSSKGNLYVAFIEAIACLRERGEKADLRFVDNVRNLANKVYKSKGTGRLNTYTQAKARLIDRLIDYVRFYRKEYLVDQLEKIKMKLQ